MEESPLECTIDELSDIVRKIAVEDSPVGIDAKLTHAMILAYLRKIDARLARLESRMGDMPASGGGGAGGDEEE